MRIVGIITSTEEAHQLTEICKNFVVVDRISEILKDDKNDR